VSVTLSHRLILPVDTNHHGTLYAGSLLRIALEAAYATGFRHVGASANLLLRRVLNLECVQPVPVGSVVELQGLVLHQSRAYLVVALVGTPLSPSDGPWLEALLGFAQVDADGKLTELPNELAADSPPDTPHWKKLEARLQKLLRLR
jgi:acyl-CoA thioesterase YciA